MSGSSAPEISVSLNQEEIELLHSQEPERIFTYIYENNLWNGQESISGSGSDSPQTTELIAALQAALQSLQIESLLDIPCGDFFWMQKVVSVLKNYVGGDIVTPLIQSNNSRFGSPEKAISFMVLDILKSQLPSCDALLCRDCLVHLSFKHIKLALKQIMVSGSRYLITTTFPSRVSNDDILTGMWRPLNLQASPFFFPPPLSLINESCSEANGAFSDKSLGIWEISDLRRYSSIWTE